MLEIRERTDNASLEIKSSEDFFSIFRGLALRDEASVRALEFARFVLRFSSRFDKALEDEPIALGFASYLAWCVVQDSHTCLALKTQFLKDYVQEKGLDWFWKNVMGPQEFVARIRRCQAVGDPGNTSRPLIMDGSRLYIQRYWWYETGLASWIREKVARRLPVSEGVFQLAKKLFPKGPAVPDWQKIASVNVVCRSFGVISGGPGTGKTRTVAAIMALVAENEMASGKEVSVALCAPTGKAAARLTESFQRSLSQMALPDRIKSVLPDKAVTIHRLLGVSPRDGRFRHNKDHPLPWDTVLIDEASMVDLPLMVHLVEALKDDARLVLIGDKDQLASVEAGSVLADICRASSGYSYSADFIDLAERVDEKITPGPGEPSPLRDVVVTLAHNFRFQQGSGIHQLAEAVNKGNYQGAMDVFQDESLGGARFVSSSRCPLHIFLEREMSGLLKGLKGAEGPEEALTLLQAQRILCGVKEGPLGTKTVNGFMASLFDSHVSGARGIYHGMPVIIRENDYSIGLFNGDNGVIWRSSQGRLLAHFMDSDTMRKISPARLPRYEPAWAITVHVSQGSEFDKVVLVLPSEQSAIIGRELLYTAITRAKDEIVIWGSEDALKKAIKRPTYRESGLADRLTASFFEKI
ncbi:MAG: exodeoxyribonuclease V subunit alpha [Thermodesulfobacteria bacterium]|nr:exodeoxyribonuclease V subunit alpha [Thermodesulfobacteriota bacterium]